MHYNFFLRAYKKFSVFRYNIDKFDIFATNYFVSSKVCSCRLIALNFKVAYSI
jgi:hypothetical protein